MSVYKGDVRVAQDNYGHWRASSFNEDGTPLWTSEPAATRETAIGMAAVAGYHGGSGFQVTTDGMTEGATPLPDLPQVNAAAEAIAAGLPPPPGVHVDPQTRPQTSMPVTDEDFANRGAAMRDIAAAGTIERTGDGGVRFVDPQPIVESVEQQVIAGVPLANVQTNVAEPGLLDSAFREP